MSNVKRFIARYKIEDMRMPLNDEGVRMWRAVAEALKLTPDQAAATAQLWRSFRSACLLVEANKKQGRIYIGEICRKPVVLHAQDGQIQPTALVVPVCQGLFRHQVTSIMLAYLVM